MKSFPIGSINLRQPVTGTRSEITMGTSSGISGISMLVSIS